MNDRITDEHLLNLRVAFESRDFRIDPPKLVDDQGRQHANPQQLIDEMLSLDLIESGDDGKGYYLSEFGIEVAENGVPVDDDYNWVSPYERAEGQSGEEGESIESGFMTILKRTPYVPVMAVFALIFAFYVSQRRKKPQQTLPPLSEEVLEDIKTEIETHLDSLEKVK